MDGDQRRDAAALVLQRLVEHGQDDIARRYVERIETSGIDLGKYLWPSARRRLEAAKIERPPGIYIPLVIQPAGVSRRDHSLSAALLVPVGWARGEALAWRHAELADEVARRFVEVTGFRLTDRIVIGSRDLRANLDVEDLRSAEAGMLLFALLDLEERLCERGDAPKLEGRRVVVTGNLLNARSPEGQDVVVGRVDDESLPVKLEAAQSGLVRGDLVIIPACNLAEPRGAVEVREVEVVEDMATALTPFASLRAPSPWSLGQRAVGLRERLLGEKLDAGGLRAVAESAAKLRAMTPAHESEAEATLEGVLALVALHYGDLAEAWERLGGYAQGRPGFDNFGPGLRSHLVSIRAQLLAQRGEYGAAIAELDRVEEKHIPEREFHLLELTRVECLVRLAEDGLEPPDASQTLARALSDLASFPHAHRETLAHCRALVRSLCRPV